jgi:hypothetical protein
MGREKQLASMTAQERSAMARAGGLARRGTHNKPKNLPLQPATPAPLKAIKSIGEIATEIDLDP